MQSQLDPLLIAGSSHPALAAEVSQILGLKLGAIALSQFPDGEVSCEILESVRGREVFILQTIALTPDRYLMELLIIADALRRASAKSITAVIPYYGYCRQDRKEKPREPITAKLVANLLTTSGINHVLTLDLHAGQVQGFFDIPLDNLNGRPTLVEAFKALHKDQNNCVVVTPDVGSVKIARNYANNLGVDFVIIDKHRVDPLHIDTIRLIGDVKGKDVLLADDMCTTGETLLSAAKACQEKGASRIFAVVTHGLLVGDSIENLEKSPIEALIITNTVPSTRRFERSKKIHTVSIAPLLAEAISCLFSQKSIQHLY